MRAEILITNGRMQLLTPVHLKPDAPSHYYIEVPDDAIQDSRDWFVDEFNPKEGTETVPHQPKASQGSFQARLNQILGNLARTRPGASIGDDYQTLQDTMKDRYFGR